MPTVVTERPYRPVPTDPPRKRWTREECKRLEASGVCDGLKLELVEGELINKMGKTRPHVVIQGIVRRWLSRVFGDEHVDSGAPIDVAPEDDPTSEPEPDLIVLARPSTEFSKNPKPENLRLVIEISDSSVGFDLTKKAELSARARIVDYWVFDVQARRIAVHRNPANGLYHSVVVYGRDESVSPLAAPDQQLSVREAFCQLSY
jgi:Uma2 family endonuclease